MRQFIKTRLRRALVALPVSAALVVVLLPVSGCSRRPAPAPAPSRPAAAAPAPRIPTGSEVFASATTSLTTSLESARRALSRGSTDATAIAAVRDFAATLPELDRGVQADFAKTRGILAKVGSKEKDAIESRVERTYAKRRDALAKRLAAVTSAESTSALKSAIASTADYLDSITPEEPYQPLGTSLPHRIVDAKAGPPVLGAKIAPAYAPNTPGATPSTLPVTPTAADTTQTVEVQFSPEIAALVASLGSDPVRLYEYVRNTIDFEPYYGSRKGATETLLEGSGNDIDTASLLIALYRAAGIPARYVSGVVDVPIEKAMNWVGVETPEAAAKLFSAGGTPTKLLISGGKPKTLQIEHTWAEVYVAYEDYRGAGEGTGEKIWVPLDGSYKQYERIPPRASVQATDDAGLLAGAVSIDSQTGEVSLPGIGACGTRLESEVASTPILDMAEAVNALGSKAIRAIPAGILPSTIACRVQSIGSEWTRVPMALQERVAVSTPGLDFTATVTQLIGQKVVIGSKVEGAEDALIVASAGRERDVPAYLVRFVPYLAVGDHIVATGTAVAGGDALRVRVSLEGPNAESFDAEDLIDAGGTYCIQIDTGRSARVQLERALRSMQSSQLAVENSQPIDRILIAWNVATDSLRLPALIYFAEVAAAGRISRAALRTAAVPMTSLAMTGVRRQASRVLGVPTSMAPKSLFIDVDALRFSSIAVDGGPGRAYGDLVGVIGSMLEAEVWRQVLGPEAPAGVSTTTIIRAAIEQGMPLLLITPENRTAIVSQLTVDSDVRTSVMDAASQGFTVLIPRGNVQIGDWSGSGWVVVDPGGRGAGYMIAGSIAGGEEGLSDSNVIAEWVGNSGFWDALDAASMLLDAHLLSKSLPALESALVGLATALPAKIAAAFDLVGFVQQVMGANLPEFLKIKWLLSAATQFVAVIHGVAIVQILALTNSPGMDPVKALMVGFALTTYLAVMLNVAMPAMVKLDEFLWQMASE